MSFTILQLFGSLSLILMPLLTAAESANLTAAPKRTVESLPHPYKSPAGKCLNAGGIVTLETCTGNPNQNWKLTSNGQLVNQGGTCLTLIGGSATVAACQTQPSFNWKTTPEGTLIHSSGKCLTMGGEIQSNGTRIIVTPCTGKPSQQWRS